jgi:hypothetical protein
MKSEGALLESIFQTALEGCDANVKARKDALWDGGVVLLADVLREIDPFSRQRRLRGRVASFAELPVKLNPAAALASTGLFP